MKEKKIGERLKELRKKKELTQQDLASDLGVSRQTINALESGKYLPSVLLALELADFFDIALEDFFHELKRREDKMTDELSPWSMFDDPFFKRKESLTVPQINVASKGNNVIVEADIPGVDEKDLEIEVGENSIRIAGKKETEEEIKEKDYYYKESSFGSFQRVVLLPEAVKHDKAKAEIKDGVLRITIPKTEVKKLKTVKLKAKKTTTKRAKKKTSKKK